MQQIKNIIYKGISTSSRQNFVYGYLIPSNGIDRATLVEYSETIIKYHEVYLSSLELFYEDEDFLNNPINIYELLNK